MRIYLLMIFILMNTMLCNCAPRQRFGMVQDQETGLQYGSIVERNLFIDPVQLENKRIKVSIRNISGDQAFDLSNFVSNLEHAYEAKGYEPTKGDNFGLRLDVNVIYSGQIRSDMTGEFAFLGAATGGIAGYRSNSRAGTAIGILSGVALGAIIGSYITEDTYIVVVEVNIGVLVPDTGETSTTIVFSSSKKEENKKSTGFKTFRERLSTRVAAYAGGRNVQQMRIADGVRNRLIRILSDII